MPWKTPETIMDLKIEFVQLAAQPEANMSQLCRRYHISRPTGYKWLRRYQAEGLDGLAARSRRPHTSPNTTPPAIVQQIVEARHRDPGWGGRKLRRHLLNQAEAGQIPLVPAQIPAASTITLILARHALLAPPADPSRRGHWQRFERATPNELWQLDFKGEFRVANGAYCYPLTLIDDHSRFCLTVAACPDQQRQTVEAHLRQVFRRYGVPAAILCDNGPPWGAGLGWREWGPYYTGLAVWLMRRGSPRARAKMNDLMGPCKPRCWITSSSMTTTKPTPGWRRGGTAITPSARIRPWRWPRRRRATSPARAPSPSNSPRAIRSRRHHPDRHRPRGRQVAGAAFPRRKGVQRISGGDPTGLGSPDVCHFLLSSTDSNHYLNEQEQ